MLFIILFFLSSEYMFSEWKTRRRDERESEFAPPSAYFTDERRSKPAKTKNQERKPNNTSFKFAKCPGGSSESEPEPQPQPPSVPPTSSKSSQPPPAEASSQSAPTFNPQYPPPPPPPFYPLFPPPPPFHFAGPPHVLPPFPPQYPYQYPHAFPPPPVDQSGAQQPPEGAPQSLDEILSFYRNSTWWLISDCKYFIRNKKKNIWTLCNRNI